MSLKIVIKQKFLMSVKTTKFFIIFIFSREISGYFVLYFVEIFCDFSIFCRKVSLYNGSLIIYKNNVFSSYLWGILFLARIASVAIMVLGEGGANTKLLFGIHSK